MNISRAKAYFTQHGILYGCSEKPGTSDYYIAKFDSMEKALEWFTREEYDFREREFIGEKEALRLDPSIENAVFYGKPALTSAQFVYQFARFHVAPWELAEMTISAEQAAGILDRFSSGEWGDDTRIIPDDLTPEKFVEIFDRLKTQIDPWHI